jgi:hypothetical protein
MSGIYPMYEDVRKDMGESLNPSRLRCGVVLHFEANESLRWGWVAARRGTTANLMGVK